MNLTIPEHNAGRVLSAISRRRELLAMYTRDMSSEFESELVDLDRTIAAAVSVAVQKPANEAERYIAISKGW